RRGRAGAPGARAGAAGFASSVARTPADSRRADRFAHRGPERKSGVSSRISPAGGGGPQRRPRRLDGDGGKGGGGGSWPSGSGGIAVDGHRLDTAYGQAGGPRPHPAAHGRSDRQERPFSFGTRSRGASRA